MHFKKHSVAAAAAVGMMGTANSAAIKERDDGEAFVVIHQVVTQSPSIVYTTQVNTVFDCGTLSDCPLSTSTVIELTTYCPYTETHITTIGTPSSSGPLSTITTVVTVPSTSAHSSASLITTPSVSGPGGAPSTDSHSHPASIGSISSGTASSGSTVGIPGASSVSPESTGPESESISLTTVHSTSTLVSTVTVTDSNEIEMQTLSSASFPSVSSSSSAVGVPGTASEATTSSFTFVPSTSDVSSFSTDTVGPIGGTASNSGFVTPTTNGTLNTPTPTAPTQSIVPFIGGAAGIKYGSVIGTAVIVAAAALFI